MTASPHAPRTAAERGLPSMPWGWFVVGLSHELAPGQIETVRYFDRDLVLYRTEGGEARLWPAHCPHMGAHLGFGGTVIGETLRCPFHHWRFDGRGQCIEVPGCERIPPTGKTTPWPVREHNGAIWAWHHPDGLAPDHEVDALPDEGWTAPRCIRWELRSHPQEIGENTVDIAHMKPVHDTGISKVRWGPDLDGPRMRIGLYFLAPGSIIGMEGDNDVELDVTMVGVGIIEVQTHVTNAGVHARYRICSTPIDHERIHIYGIANMQRTGDAEFDEEVAELFFEALTRDFVKDFDIWENKLYRARPALSGADGPVGAYRRWAKQFYRPQAAMPEATPAPEPSVGAATASDSSRLLPVGGLLSRVRGVATAVRSGGLRGGLASLSGVLSEVTDGARRRLGGDARAPGRAGNGHAARGEYSGGNGHAARGGHSGGNGHAARGEHSGGNGHAARGEYSGGNGHAARGQYSGGNGHAARAGGTGHAAAAPPSSGQSGPVPKITSVADYFATLEQRFVPSATRGLEAVFQWEIAGDGGGTYHAIVNDGTMTLVPGKHARPTVTIAMNAADYVRVVNGELDGARAFTTGGGKVRGKIRMAMKMRSIFPMAS